MARAGRPDPNKKLARWLEAERWPTAPAGLVYRGPADFVLQHGEWHMPGPLPEGIPRMTPGHCYSNAIILSIEYGLDYVEGFALEPDLKHVYPHAWNVDDAGRAIDSTWTGDSAIVIAGELAAVTDVVNLADLADLAQVLPVTVFTGRPGAAYVGVRFSVERADDCTWNGDACVIDDRNRDWPLFRERWHGEPADIEWPYSPRLEALRLKAAGHVELGRALLKESA
ncbi:MAG: hypothetical protein ACJ79H_21700 [Myxococcales bacterium]